MNMVMNRTNLKIAFILLHALYNTIMRFFTYGTSTVGILVLLSMWDNATTKSFAQYTPAQVYAMWQSLNTSFAFSLVIGLVLLAELMNIVLGHTHPIQRAIFELIDMGVLKSKFIDNILSRSEEMEQKFPPYLKVDIRNALLSAAFVAVVFTWLLSGNTITFTVMMFGIMVAVNLITFRLGRKFFPNFYEKYFGK